MKIPENYLEEIQPDEFGETYERVKETYIVSIQYSEKLKGKLVLASQYYSDRDQTVTYIFLNDFWSKNKSEVESFRMRVLHSTGDFEFDSKQATEILYKYFSEYFI